MADRRHRDGSRANSADDDLDGTPVAEGDGLDGSGDADDQDEHETAQAGLDREPDELAGDEVSDTDAELVDDTSTADGAAPVRARGRTGWERLSDTFLRPASQPGRRPEPEKIDYASMSDDEKRARISRIDPMERKVGLAASILAGVFAIVYTVPYMVSKISVATTVKPVHKTCTHGYTYVASTNTCNGVYPASHYALPLVLWLVFAAAIYVTVRIGRRAPMAFAIVLTGLAFGTVIIMLPYVVAGGWLLLRAYRTQKYGAPTAKAPLDGYVRPPPRSMRGTAAGSTGGTRGGTRSATRRRRRDEPDAAPDARRPPTASKRYTPKSAPKRKAPPPS